MGFSRDDTIAAIATPPGRGGIGVIRVSGPAAHRIARQLLGRDEPLQPRYSTLGHIHTIARSSADDIARPAAIDEVLATYFPAPHSYTGDDVVEISGHGSPVLLTAILEGATRCGARLAEPGEFTLRAYLNGRLDLVQAEAVVDLVDAVTPTQARAAYDQLQGTLTARIAQADRVLFDLVARLEASLDFPDEGYHFVDPHGVAKEIDGVVSQIDAMLSGAAAGRLLREGATVVIAGRPNVGKSTLFNRLVGAERAIVTDAPGTTRDLVTERAAIRGIPITFVDTAGLRSTAEEVERLGVERAKESVHVAGLVLGLLDWSRPLTDDDSQVIDTIGHIDSILVLNQIDRPAAWSSSRFPDMDIVRVSGATGEGLDELRERIVMRLTGVEPLMDTVAVTNLRHARLLERAREALQGAAVAARGHQPEELLLSDLHAARVALEEITGARTTDDVLAHIFSRFCIGK